MYRAQYSLSDDLLFADRVMRGIVKRQGENTDIKYESESMI